MEVTNIRTCLCYFSVTDTEEKTAQKLKPEQDLKVASLRDPISSSCNLVRGTLLSNFILCLLCSCRILGSSGQFGGYSAKGVILARDDSKKQCWSSIPANFQQLSLAREIEGRMAQSLYKCRSFIPMIMVYKFKVAKTKHEKFIFLWTLPESMSASCSTNLFLCSQHPFHQWHNPSVS